MSTGEPPTPETPPQPPVPPAIAIAGISGAVTDSRIDIRVGDVTIQAPTPAQALHQLPAPRPDFTGRTAELEDCSPRWDRRWR
jgi:hypothetical protein